MSQLAGQSPTSRLRETITIDLSKLDLATRMPDLVYILEHFQGFQLKFFNGSLAQCNKLADYFDNGDAFCKPDSEPRPGQLYFRSCHIGIKLINLFPRIMSGLSLTNIKFDQCTIDFEGTNVNKLEDFIVDYVETEAFTWLVCLRGTCFKISHRQFTGEISFDQSTFTSLGQQSDEQQQQQHDPDFPLEFILNVWKRSKSLSSLCLQDWTLSKNAVKKIRNAISSMESTRKIYLELSNWDPDANDNVLELVQKEPRLVGLYIREEDPTKKMGIPIDFLAEILSSSLYLERFSVQCNLSLDRALDDLEALAGKIKYPNRLESFKIHDNEGPDATDESTEEKVRKEHRRIKISFTTGKMLQMMQTKKVKVFIALIHGASSHPKDTQSFLRMLPLDVLRLLSIYL